MNEIKHIYLGQRQFTIAVDAHLALNKYLKAIESALGTDEKDVLDEVELRMAELLTERGLDAEKVVVGKDVDYLKEQLGRPQDFAAATDAVDDDTGDQSEDKQSRRLFRDTGNSLVAGVASGLAAYLRVSPTVIRIAFVVLGLFKGFGLLLYALLWFLMPEAKSSSDRLQMRGEAVNVQNLRHLADRADLPQAAQRVSLLIRQIIALAFKAVAVWIGVMLALGSFVGIIITWIAGTSLLADKVTVGGAHIFPVGTAEHSAVIIGGITLTLVGALLLILGISSINPKHRWLLPSWVTVTLISTVLVGAIATSSLIASVAPDVEHRYQGLNTTIDRTVPAFSKLDLSGDQVRYVFVDSDDYHVELSRFGKIQTSALVTSVKDDTLYVDAGKLAKASRITCDGYCFRSYNPIQVVIYAPRLTDLSVHGSNSNVALDSLNQTDDLHLTVDKRSNLMTGGTTASGVTVDATQADNWTATLHQLRPLNRSNDLLSLYPQTISLGGAVDQVSLSLPAACRTGENLVSLETVPGQLTVNGQMIATDNLPKDDSLATIGLAPCVELDQYRY